jgi:hypothetical protein
MLVTLWQPARKTPFPYAMTVDADPVGSVVRVHVTPPSVERYSWLTLAPHVTTLPLVSAAREYAVCPEG